MPSTNLHVHFQHKAQTQICMHLYLQAQECSDEEREDLLGEFLTFINTLSATHQTLRSVLASDPWFQMLLRIVDVDLETGEKLPTHCT